MKSVLLAAALALGAAAQLTINTPTPGAAECQPFLIQWSGGTPPYFLTITTNPPGTTPFVDFGQLSGTSQTWTVNGTLGQSLIFNIKDNTGLIAQSAAFTVTTGSGDGCIGAGGASSPGGSSAAPGGSSGGAGPTSAGSGSTAGGASTAKPSGSNTGSGSTPSKTPSGAVAVGVPAGVLPAFAAVLGAGLIALLA